jgi:hypothetical protein
LVGLRIAVSVIGVLRTVAWKNQEIVVTYTRIDPGFTLYNVMAGRSSNGTPWTRAQVTTNTAPSDGGALANGDTLAFPCVSATTSRLWVVHDELDSTLSNVGVVLHWSDDDGATWSATNSTVVQAISTSGTFDDPSCAGNGSDVWVEYELGGGFATVASSTQVAHSSTGGSTFGAPVDVQDTTASALSWHAQVVLEGNGGWLGDYVGVTTAGGVLYTTYTDNSSGTAHIAFGKAMLP